MRRAPLAAILSATLALTASCNNYELFRVAGYEQASFSNEADIIFIIDNSPSMVGESEALALNFGVFLDTLLAAESSSGDQSALSDAVGGYITYVTDRGALIDYQMGISTTSVSDSGAPGDAGELVGDPRVIVRGDADVEETFLDSLLCEAVCWKECTYDTEREETGDCIEDASEGFDPDNPDEINVDYLHDVCGVNEWEGHCGSGTEEPIEAALLAMCRAVDEPPDFCYDAISNFESGDEGTNSGLLRETATALIVILTDEGDSSRRLATGETSPQEYLDLFDRFNARYRFAVIGPPYDASDPQNQDCVAGAQPWGIARLYEFTDATDGLYEWLWDKDKEDDGSCAYTPTDFAETLENLGQLLNSLLTYFPLQSVPDPATIHAFVNDEEVPAASLSETTGEYGDGWSYDAAQNAVEFHGDYVPDYNADVRIYYKPLEGMPRELPF